MMNQKQNDFVARRTTEEVKSLFTLFNGHAGWCQNAIKKLEELLVKKPSKRREIEQLKHQIREKELKLAFDPQYGGEVKELPIERKFADKLEEGLGKNKTLPELLRDSINKISLQVGTEI